MRTGSEGPSTDTRRIEAKVGNLVVRSYGAGPPDIVLGLGLFFDERQHTPLALELVVRFHSIALVNPPGFGGSEVGNSVAMESCSDAVVEVAKRLGAESRFLGGTCGLSRSGGRNVLNLGSGAAVNRSPTCKASFAKGGRSGPARPCCPLVPAQLPDQARPRYTPAFVLHLSPAFDRERAKRHLLRMPTTPRLGSPVAGEVGGSCPA